MRPRTGFRALLVCLAVALALVPIPAAAEILVRYLIAPEIIVVDPDPDGRFSVGPDAGALFGERFEKAFPGQVMTIGPDTMISPNDRVVVVVPKITVARSSHEVAAGNVHRMEAVVVGDVTAMDFWSEASLYSGTRMVSGEVTLGESKMNAVQEEMAKAFRIALGRWMDVTIEQMRQCVIPFVVAAGTVKQSDGNKLPQGGIWPKGGLAGLKVGIIIQKTGGGYARVTSVAPKHSVIQDVLDPTRGIPEGESYCVLLVDKPTERPEPTVSLSWVGPEPDGPDDLKISVLGAHGFTSLFDNYLTKDGGLRILPTPLPKGPGKQRLDAFAKDINAHSALVEGNLLAVDREMLVQKATWRPDAKVELGMLDRYHGSRARSDGTVEHFYRVTLAAALYRRTGADEDTIYPLVEVFTHTEELAQVSMKGVRDIDPADAFFTVCRNGIINLAGKSRERMTTALSAEGRSAREGVMGKGGNVDWEGTSPGAFTSLAWLRPLGEAQGTDGRSLGLVLTPMKPSQGYLNPTVLSGEKVKPGDVLRFEGDDEGTPIVGLRYQSPEGAPSWFPEREWMQRLAAEKIRPVLGARIVLVDDGTMPSPVSKRVLVLPSDISLNTQGADRLFSGKWRVRVFARDDAEGSEPRLKTGISSDIKQVIDTKRTPLEPPDVSGAAWEYVLTSLKGMADMAKSKGIQANVAARP